MKIAKAFVTSLLTLMAAGPMCFAQAPITTVQLTPDQIGMVKTAQGITTRVSFPDQVSAVICGDLYDAGSGKGIFVVQQIGKDVFLKPIVSKGMSNMFVKTGENGEHVYNFDLEIVVPAQAHRVVNVIDAGGEAVKSGDGAAGGSSATEQERQRAEAEHLARQQADEILRNARQQAERITAEAEARIPDIERTALQRGQQLAERRFVQALLLGIRDARINNPRVSAKKVTLTLDPRVLTFDDKSYLRYTIQNNGDQEFAFSTISLESGQEPDAKPVVIELTQTKEENRLAPGESMTGVLSYDPANVGPKDRLTLYVRGEDNAEIAHIIISR